MLGIFISFLLATSATAIWPKPRLVQNGTTRIVLNSNTYGFKALTSTVELEDAFRRYKSIFFPHATEPVPDPSNNGLVVDILDPTAALALGVNESYTLDVHLDGTTFIAAKTVWGALHGLETMSQLVDFNFATGQYSVSGVPVHIEDEPRFQHRGLLIDSGRHFEPVIHVKALLDSMSYAKMNVLHWHLTEDQSFPIASRVHPELAAKGAYNDFEQYTWQDIVDVVKHARLRGIRVIPEFDMPGHTSAWRKSHPEIFAEGCLTESSRGAFDPAKNETFDFLRALQTFKSKWCRNGWLILMPKLSWSTACWGCWGSQERRVFKTYTVAPVHSFFSGEGFPTTGWWFLPHSILDPKKRYQEFQDQLKSLRANTRNDQLQQGHLERLGRDLPRSLSAPGQR